MGLEPTTFILAHQASRTSENRLLRKPTCWAPGLCSWSCDEAFDSIVMRVRSSTMVVTTVDGSGRVSRDAGERIPETGVPHDHGVV